MSTPTDSPAPAASRISIADPGPLGLGAFALTTAVLSLANAGLIPGAGAAVLPLALFMGGLAQFAAGMWEFVRGNTFGATAFTSYGAFWLAFWWLETNPEFTKGAGAGGVGTFLLVWAIFTAYMTIASLKTNVATILVFLFLTLTFLVLAISEYAGSAGLGHIGGWLGLITAVFAWYTSAAGVINSTWNRAVLPVGSRA